MEPNLTFFWNCPILFLDTLTSNGIHFGLVLGWIWFLIIYDAIRFWYILYISIGSYHLMISFVQLLTHNRRRLELSMSVGHLILQVFIIFLGSCDYLTLIGCNGMSFHFYGLPSILLVRFLVIEWIISFISVYLRLYTQWLVGYRLFDTFSCILDA